MTYLRERLFLVVIGQLLTGVVCPLKIFFGREQKSVGVSPKPQYFAGPTISPLQLKIAHYLTFLYRVDKAVFVYIVWFL